MHLCNTRGDSLSLGTTDPSFENGAVRDIRSSGVSPPSNYLLYRIVPGTRQFYTSSRAMMYKAQARSGRAPVAGDEGRSYVPVTCRWISHTEVGRGTLGPRKLLGR
jgi:hypothetical protein